MMNYKPLPKCFLLSYSKYFSYYYTSKKYYSLFNVSLVMYFIIKRVLIAWVSFELKNILKYVITCGLNIS